MAALVVHSKIDDFIELVMDELNIKIPEFGLKRWFKAQIEESKTGKETLKISGITDDGTPYELFKSQKIDGLATKLHNLTEAQQTSATTKFKLNFKF